jgi:multimeric flavodoxin WrbA
MITVLNFSQRVNGINDLICAELCAGFSARNISTHYLKIRDLTINYCTNCRLCMKEPGDFLGDCPLADDMPRLLQAIRQSRSIIVSAPINCYDLPATFKIMLERMGVCCYWSDEMYMPKVRAVPGIARGLLITTSAMPGIMVRFVTRARQTFALFAKPLGMRHVSYHHLGFKGRAGDMIITEKDSRTIQQIIRKTANRCLSAG